MENTGYNIHKSGDIKNSIDDRIKKAPRAMNMLQGAKSMNGNINVDIAITLFKKQIIPILTLYIWQYMPVYV